jgi:hypothetical protein
MPEMFVDMFHSTKVSTVKLRPIKVKVHIDVITVNRDDNVLVAYPYLNTLIDGHRSEIVVRLVYLECITNHCS